jgi:C-terminal of Roc, COR, domain/Ras of Complex, Roc, domain of DAPkinase/Leucine Rich repeats (2 copies)
MPENAYFCSENPFFNLLYRFFMMMNKKPKGILELEGLLYGRLWEEPHSMENEKDIFYSYYVLGNEDHVIELRLYMFDSDKITDISFLQDLVYLQKLSLGYSKMTDIFVLQKLKNLKDLSFELGTIRDISVLKNLRKLTKLSIWGDNSPICCDMTILQNLTHLTNLHLVFTQITDISILQNLTNLTDLNLSGNQITDISALQNLTNLRGLILYNNEVTYIPLDFLKQFPKLEYLKLKGNPIKNIPKEIFDKEGNCLPELRAYLEGLEQGAIKAFYLKMLIVGNGRVGKTSLLDRWLDDKFDTNKNSTHGIQQRELPLDKLPPTDLDMRLSIWDFGGQEIYHPTHRLYMHSDNALFLVVWDADTEQQPTQTEVLPDGSTLAYQNFPMAYWLDYARTLGNGSPVHLVRTKSRSAQDYEQFMPPIKVQAKHYNIKAHAHTDALTGSGYTDFETDLYAILTENAARFAIDFPASWAAVRNRSEQDRAAGKKYILVADFYGYCAGENISEENSVQVLKYLHNASVLFYENRFDKGMVILDQAWAINAIYTLFDRQKPHYAAILKQNGWFQLDDLKTAWSAFPANEQELFLLFMQKCHICFPYKDAYNESGFIAPALMRSDMPERTAATWQTNTNDYYIKYEHPFLHYGNMQQFIVETHHLAEVTQIWKNGTVITDASGTALVEGFFAPQNAWIQVRVRATISPKILLDKVRNKLNEILGKPENMQVTCSLDGTKFLTLSENKDDLPPKYWVFLGTDVRNTFSEKDVLMALQQSMNEIKAKQEAHIKVSEEMMEELNTFDGENIITALHGNTEELRRVIKQQKEHFLLSLRTNIDVKKVNEKLDELGILHKKFNAIRDNTNIIDEDERFKKLADLLQIDDFWEYSRVSIIIEWFFPDKNATKKQRKYWNSNQQALAYTDWDDFDTMNFKLDKNTVKDLMIGLYHFTCNNANNKIEDYSTVVLCFGKAVENELNLRIAQRLRNANLSAITSTKDCKEIRAEQARGGYNFPFGGMDIYFNNIRKALRNNNHPLVTIFQPVFQNFDVISEHKYHKCLDYDFKYRNIENMNIPKLRNIAAHAGGFVTKQECELYMEMVKTFLVAWNAALI